MSLLSHAGFVAAGASRAADGDVARMSQIVLGELTLQIVRTAAVHGLADHAAAGPVDPAGFAAAAGLDPALTVRFLRAAAAVELLTTDGSGLFHGTSLLDTLRSDRSDSMRDEVLTAAHDMTAAPCAQLPEVVRTGHDRAEQALGAPFFDYLAADPARMALFFRCMASFTAGVADRVLDVLDLDGVRSIVDVGGADGSLARAFLRAYPDLHATVLDTPQAIGAARDAAAAEGLSGRLDAVGGDFFTGVPRGDVALLKLVIHDWSDEESVTILRHCRDAVGPAGRVVIVEQVAGEPGSEVTPLFDMLMLAVLGGRERTRGDLEALAHRAGLSLRAVLHTGAAIQVIEAVPSP